MRYKFKRLTMPMVRNDEIELPKGAVIIKAEFSTVLAYPGENYRVWVIDYLEPIKGKK